MPANFRTKRVKLSSEVSEEILAMIDQGEVPLAGQLPTENELGDRLGVSRTSVREAVKSLAALGVLEIRPGVGTFVVDGRPGPLRTPPGGAAGIKREALLDLLEFRCLFEPEVAALAAERATESDLAEMLRCVEVLRSAVEEGVRPPEDLGFHLALARATRNESVVDVSRLIIRFYNQDVYLPDVMDVHGHRRIYEAVLGRNPAAARAAMRAHLQEIQERYHQET